MPDFDYPLTSSGPIVEVTEKEYPNQIKNSPVNTIKVVNRAEGEGENAQVSTYIVITVNEYSSIRHAYGSEYTIEDVKKLIWKKFPDTEISGFNNYHDQIYIGNRSCEEIIQALGEYFSLNPPAVSSRPNFQFASQQITEPLEQLPTISPPGGP